MTLKKTFMHELFLFGLCYIAIYKLPEIYRLLRLISVPTCFSSCTNPDGLKFTDEIYYIRLTKL